MDKNENLSLRVALASLKICKKTSRSNKIPKMRFLVTFQLPIKNTKTTQTALWKNISKDGKITASEKKASKW